MQMSKKSLKKNELQVRQSKCHPNFQVFELKVDFLERLKKLLNFPIIHSHEKILDSDWLKEMQFIGNTNTEKS